MSNHLHVGGGITTTGSTVLTHQGPECAICTVERKRATFVEQWRQEHAIDTWGAPWLCPLCNKAVQDFFALTPCDAQIEIHQESHGADWLNYQALTTADPQPAPTATDRREG